MSTDPSSQHGTATPESQQGRDFDVFRLRLGDAVALLAAFALLFIMAGDWYSTATGAEAREIVERQGTNEPGVGLFDDGAVEDARIEAEQAERNAWQISSPIDLVVLLALLATIGLTLAAAALRAAGREFPDLARSPRALAAYAALLSLFLVALQAAVRLDPDSDAVIQIGLPLGVAALGMIACGAGLALRDEHRVGESDRAPRARASARDEAATDGPGAAADGTYNRAP